MASPSEPLSARALVFTGPGEVVVQDRLLDPPGPGEVRVRAVASAISAGTELLAYRGELPEGLPLDATLPALSGRAAYPFEYGYAIAGVVEAIGPEVPGAWLERPVFAFHPHASRFNAPLSALTPIPPDFSHERAVLLPTAETAVSLVQDAAPIFGERALVLGQGVVGLFVSALLRRFPLERLVAIDGRSTRRAAALALGVDRAFADASAARELLGPEGADLAFELTGDPRALDAAIACVGFEGRVVVGSWYGSRRAPIDLGAHFHRGRIRLMSSQVSHIAPALSGRWTKWRRLERAFAAIEAVGPERWISARYPVEEAASAYRALAEPAGEHLQILLTYR